MVEYSKVNVKLSDTQLKKLKNAVKNKTGTILRISLKMFNGNDLPHSYYWQQDKETKLRNGFDNNMSTDLKLSRAQISKIIQSGEFLGSFLSKLAGPLIKLANHLAKNVLAPLASTAAASAIDAGIKKNTWYWNNNFNNFKWRTNDIMKIVQALKNYNILIKGVLKQLKMKQKNKKENY